MRSILLLPFILLLFFSDVEAQTQFEKWHKETIYLTSNGYVKEGKRYSRGLFNGKLSKEFRDSPIALMEFRKSRKNQNIAIGLTTLGLASYLIGFDQGIDGNERNAFGFLIGGAILSLASVPLSLKSNTQLHRAVWMHNGDLILPKEK